MPYELIENQVVYNGKKVRLELHHLRDLETDRNHKREVVVHPGAVVVVALTEEKKIVLIRVRRYAINHVLVELPAGTVEPKEPPINTAGRELLEETGYLAGRMKPLCSFFTSPGILTEKMYAFVATELEKGNQALEEGEEIEVFEATIEQALDMIKHGQIQDGKSIVALMMYERFSQMS